METITDTSKPTATQIQLSQELRAKMKPSPELPTEYVELYQMACKKGSVLMHLIFWFSEKKVDAIEAGRKYCERHGLRFIWVENYCIDIHAEPKKLSSND